MKFPWKGVALGSGILTFLVAVRSIITAGRFMYYGGVYWQKEVFGDPWFYVGMVAAAVCVVALLALAGQSLKSEDQEENEEGRGE